MLGALIGNLFGHKKPRIPTASAQTILQIPYANYAVGSVSSANGGNADMVKGEAQAAANTLNGLIARVTGGATPSFVANGYSPTQVYGHTGSQLWVKLGGTGAAQTNVDSGDQAVDKGVLWALPQTQIIGGDIFIKRAIKNTAADSVTAMAGDIQIASDYSFYTRNRDLINGYITGAYATLTQPQMDFYSNNKALVDKVDTQGVGALTSSELSAYTSNQSTIDSIVQALQNQAIANPWIITLQRANELGLMNWSASDVYGGLGGFAQSFGLETPQGGVGGAHVEDLFLDWDAASNGLKIRSAAPIARGDSVFSILPQATTATVDNDIFNPNFQNGWKGWYTETWQATSGEYTGVNLPYWFGNGNDVLYNHIYGAPANALADTRSEKMAASAGVTYEASVLAAQHRGVAIVLMEFYDANGNMLSSVQLGAGGSEGGSWQGADGTYTRIGGFATAPTGTAYRRINLRLQTIGSDAAHADAYAFYTHPLSRAISPGQTALSNWDSVGEGVTIANFNATMGYNSWAGYGSGANDIAIRRSNQSYQDLEAPNDQNVIFVGGDAGNTLVGGSGSSWLQGGDGNDSITTTGGFNTIIAGGGNDTIHAEAGTNNYIAAGSGVDSVYTGAGVASVIGGDGWNAQTTVFAGGGSITFIASQYSAWDAFVAGVRANNTVSFERYTHGVTADLMNHPSWLTNAWGDSYASYLYQADGNSPIGYDFSMGVQANNLRGSSYNDWLRTNELGGTLEGGGGADTLIGGGGRTAASYAHSSAGVYVDLSTNTAYGGDAAGDTFSNVLDLIGSNFADELKGVSGSILNGGAGDDWFDYSGGNNQYIGGDGFDTVDYSAASSGIYMNLNGGAYWAAPGDTYSSIEQVIGTSSSDYIWGNSSADTTFQGGGGTDYLYGGSGSDTYVVNRGDGQEIVTDTNTNSNVIKFGADVAFHDLWVGTAGGSNGFLQFGIRDPNFNTYIQVQGNFGAYPVSSNNIAKVLSLNGSGSVDIGQLTYGVGGDDYDNMLYGLSNRYNVIFGYNGNDTIAADSYQWSNQGSFVVGSLGNDTIYTSTGDDQFGFDRGDGHDTIIDSGGEDSIIFGPTVAADDVIYEVVGDDLYIGVRDLTNPNITASNVADNIRVVGGGAQYVNLDTGATTFNTIEFVQAGGTSVDLRKLNINWTVQYTGGYGGRGGGGGFLTPPVVLDLTGDGLELTPVADSDIVTVDRNGVVTRMGWVGPTNGILASDRKGDGKINSLSDISFISDKAGATSDLGGLAAWDTNGDGVISSLDDGWKKLVVWVDANQNGQTEKGEVKTLDQLGITSISLNGSPTGFDGSDTIDSYVTQTTSFTRSDGTSGTAYDVALAHRFLTARGIESATDVKWKDLTSEGTIGQLLNNPVAVAQELIDGSISTKGYSKEILGLIADAKKTGAVGAKLVSALADVSLNSGGKKSSHNADLFADLQDSAKAFRRRNADKDHGIAPSDAVRNTAASDDWASQLYGRGGKKSIERLQVLAAQLPRTTLTLVAPTASNVRLDIDADGTPDHIGWVSSGALIAFDSNGNGRVDGASELGFLAQVGSAKSLATVLKLLDTNGDGVLNASDSTFGRFLLWRDVNQNGLSDSGETKTFSDAGVASISLKPISTSPDNRQRAANQVVAELAMTFSDGKTASLFDVALGVDDPTQDTRKSASAGASAPAGATRVPEVATTSLAPLTSPAPSAAPTSTAGLSLGVSAVRGSGEGPEGPSLAGDLISSDVTGAEAWWASLTATGASSLGLRGAPAPSATDLEPISVRTAPVNDAATLQSQLLLRQSIAGFQGTGAGGSVAVWGHDGSASGSTNLAASAVARDAQPLRPALPVAA